MTAKEAQPMPAGRIKSADNTINEDKDKGFLPKPFAVRDCPPGMRIRGARPMQRCRGTDSKPIVNKKTGSQKKKGAGMVPTKVMEEEVHE
ncbi:unnamed protein product [Calypogeia fissa]